MHASRAGSGLLAPGSWLLAPSSLARSLPPPGSGGASLHHAQYCTPGPRSAALRPAPRPSRPFWFFDWSRCPPPSRLGGSRTLFGHPERAPSERARQPTRSQRSAQKGRKGPRCGLSLTPGERGLALAAVSAQIPRGSLSQRPSGLSNLGTMRFSAVATSAPLLVAALQVLFLLEAVHSVQQNRTQTSQTREEMPRVTANDTVIQLNPPSTTTKPVTSPPSTNTSASSNKTTEAPQVTTRLPTPAANSTVTPVATTRSSPQSTTAHSTSKSSAATASNSTMTTTAALATATANINALMNKGSKFDIGSFVGGIVLTLGVLSILYIGCKTYYSRGIRYRTIDEHDAII
ncbi:porimin [Vombatus ursinus]|nr:porimin [Vombatus ursinus]